MIEVIWLENQNEELQKKVEKLEFEVSEMKKKLDFLLTRETVLKQNEVQQKEKVSMTPAKPIQKVVKQNSTTPKETIDFEALIFQKWLPRFFIFIFIIGIMWGFKAASDYGVLNKYAKVGIGFAFAILLFWYGNRQVQAKRVTLGQTLLGGILPVLFLTTFAMHHLYNMIGSNVAFLLQGIWVGVGFYFMNKYKSEAIGLISIIGAILIPFLIKSTAPNYLFFAFYETSIYLLFMFYAAFKKYKYLYSTSAILLNLVYIVVGLLNFNLKGFEYFAFSIIIQHFGLLTILLISKFSKKKQILMLHTSFIISIGWVFSGYEDNTRTIILILLCVSYLFLSNLYKKQSDLFFAFSTNFLLAFSFLCLDSVTVHLLNTVLIIQAILTYLFYIRYRDFFKLIIASLTIIPVGIRIVSEPITSITSFNAMDWIVLIIATITIAIIAYKNEKEKHVILVSSSLVITLIIIAYITQIVQILTTDFSDNVISLTINLSWIIISIIAMVLGSLKKFKVWTYIGVGLLLLTLCKLVLVDLPNITLLVRAGLFILLGLIGLIISRIFFKGK